MKPLLNNNSPKTIIANKLQSKQTLPAYSSFASQSSFTSSCSPPSSSHHLEKLVATKKIYNPFCLRNINLVLVINILCLCTLIIPSIPTVYSLNQIGCAVDNNVCERTEYCIDDSFLGRCVSLFNENENENMILSGSNEESDEPIKEALRSEIEQFNDINTPIRIHKYSLDSDDENESSEESDEDQSQEVDRDNESSFLNDSSEENSSKDDSSEDDSQGDDDDDDEESAPLDNVKRSALGYDEEDDDRSSEEASSDLSVLLPIMKRPAIKNSSPSNIDELLNRIKADENYLDEPTEPLSLVENEDEETPEETVDDSRPEFSDENEDENDEDQSNEINDDDEEDEDGDAKEEYIKSLLNNNNDEAVESDDDYDNQDDQNDEENDYSSSEPDDYGLKDELTASDYYDDISDGEDDSDQNDRTIRYKKSDKDAFASSDDDTNEDENQISVKDLVNEREPSDDLIYNPPVVYENEGVDKNGNRFYDKEVIISGSSGKANPFVDQYLDYSQQVIESPLRVDATPVSGNDEYRPINSEFKTIGELIESNIFGNRAEKFSIPSNQQQHQQHQHEQIESNQPQQPIRQTQLREMMQKQAEDRHKLMQQQLQNKLKMHQRLQDQLLRQSEFFHGSLINRIMNPIWSQLENDINTMTRNQIRAGILHQQLPPADDENSLLENLKQTEANRNDVNKFLEQKRKNVKQFEDEDSSDVQNLKQLESSLNDEQEEFVTKLIGLTIDESNGKEVSSENDIMKSPESLRHTSHNHHVKLHDLPTVDSSYVFIELDRTLNDSEADDLLNYVSSISSIPQKSFHSVSTNGNLIVFKVEDPKVKASKVVDNILKYQIRIQKDKNLKILACGLGKNSHRLDVRQQIEKSQLTEEKAELFTIISIVVCVIISISLIILFAFALVKRRRNLRAKIVDTDFNIVKKKAFDDEERLVKSAKCERKPWYSYLSKNRNKQAAEMSPNDNYSELCRERMQTKSPLNSTICTTVNDQSSNTPAAVAPQSKLNNTKNSTPIKGTTQGEDESARSSSSSWSEEPISNINMDITTGHVILSYMEEHLNDKNRLSKEWNDLCNYEAEPNKTEIGQLPENINKNRYSNIIPYDHLRVKLVDTKNGDYINASYITDDDPKNPAYIATQGPLINTTNSFWQMVWEQRSVVIVNLCKTVENGTMKCYQYWPSNGFEVYDKYEVHLVSEHVWCDDYLVRNFFLKNLETNQTRTVTQFHFLTWPENEIPQNIKSILDFRRKVNKSYKSKSCPILVHCNDGVGRTGTYVMIDMVLNKIVKGAKEIDLAATLEYMRDQRPEMIKNKDQFEFSFLVITEEVQNMLKALGQ